MSVSVCCPTVIRIQILHGNGQRRKHIRSVLALRPGMFNADCDFSKYASVDPSVQFVMQRSSNFAFLVLCTSKPEHFMFFIELSGSSRTASASGCLLVRHGGRRPRRDVRLRIVGPTNVTLAR